MASKTKWGQRWSWRANFKNFLLFSWTELWADESTLFRCQENTPNAHELQHWESAALRSANRLSHKVTTDLEKGPPPVAALTSSVGSRVLLLQRCSKEREGEILKVRDFLFRKLRSNQQAVMVWLRMGERKRIPYPVPVLRLLFKRNSCESAVDCNPVRV